MFNLDDFAGLGRKKLWRLINLFVSEFIATGILLFLLCSIVNTLSLGLQVANLTTIALAGGFAVGTAVMSFAHISGAHINPAISMAAVMLGHMSFPLAVLYMIAQCTGSFTAYSLSMAIMPPFETNHTDKDLEYRCCSVPNENLQWWQVMLTEFLGSFILTLAFCSAVDKRNHERIDSLPIKFGIVLVALIIPLASYSGCSINPSRSFGPALYNWYWKNQWIYWIGPLLGSTVSAIMYRFVFDPSHMEIMPSPPPPDPSELMLRTNSHKYTDDET